MTTFITIIYIIVALVMVLSILLQAGKGGGLGSALGGGASQSVFGGSGGADFMSKLTQGFAATFMISAMYLAYASAHAGSEFLESQDEGSEGVLEADAEINYERLGPRPQPLPSPEEGKTLQAKASALVPAQSVPLDGANEPAVEEPGTPSADPAAGPSELPTLPTGELDQATGDEPAEQPGDSDAVTNGDRGDSPDSGRGDSPQSGKESLQKAPLDDKKTQGEREDETAKTPENGQVG